MLQRASFIMLLVFSSLTSVAYGQDAAAQPNTQARVERDARRFGFGVVGGVGLDPEVIDVGAHATLGPVFTRALMFRPGLEIGVGELTTTLAINLDFVYSFGDDQERAGLLPYLGVGPAFGLSHQSFSTDDTSHVSTTSDVSSNRFNFSDTNFNGGMNFIVGMRRAHGMFFEMRSTAWGVSNIRLLAGFNF